MNNLGDPKTRIYPSTTRGGKELPSSSALDSPSVMSKLATPTPTSAIRSDMSHVIDDATSAMHDTYDETISMPDTTMPLSDFLEERLARAREIENIVWLPLCQINKFGLNTLPSKTVVIPYTCGLSRPFSSAVAGEHSYIFLSHLDHSL